MQWGADLSDREFPVSSLTLVEWTNYFDPSEL